jgi:methyl-accepting chemotaxis protein
MTQANESNNRLDRLEDLMAQVLTTVAETSQQVREIATHIKAQATFHDRFDLELTELKKIVQSNAKAIEANGDRAVERARYELAAIRELRRTIRNSHAENLDRNNALQESIEDLRDIIQEMSRDNPSE